MVKRIKGEKIKLEGFNNLTKSLSFNIYDLCYARSIESQIEYLEYVDEEYNSSRLEEIVSEVTRIINAKLVQVSTQDYDPRGASVVALLNEDQPLSEEHPPAVKINTRNSDLTPNVGTLSGQAVLSAECLLEHQPLVVGHLDKSHIAIHTYPEYNQLSGIASFRVDVDIATCGMISPLSALRYLIGSFDSEVVLVDYRVRGFTRDHLGRKFFIDHDIASIQDFIDDEVLEHYIAYDVNIVSDNNFHTKMRKKDIKLVDFLFGHDVHDLETDEKKQIKSALELEIQEIFECKNIGGR
ncbi:MAG: adenosylmethionine decarboxylase [Spirochaetes bacterium]|nr:adenosylmethionine decarboxylase [Spirochaetota bacterium]